MLARTLADLVVAVHLAFIVFVMLGGLAVLRWPKLAWLHVPAAIWGVWIEFSGRICPLTPLENHFRAIAGDAGYDGGFVEHYLIPLIYPHDLSRASQFVLGALVLLVNAGVYAWLWRRGKR